ncbi:MAG: hypothetical protein CM15mL4_3000 [uncultured marine virus]|nr:MAG: hypothetical protein CM15mL4_3000 [uncultured marine virus]
MRTAGIEHAREVRDLLGGDYYVDYADDFRPDGKKVWFRVIIAYHNETTVDWFVSYSYVNTTSLSSTYMVWVVYPLLGILT